MHRNKTLAGSTINLEVTYRDAEGILMDLASGPEIKILDSEGTIIVDRTGDSILHIDTGKYRYAFDVPSDGPTGQWSDVWYPNDVTTVGVTYTFGVIFPEPETSALALNSIVSIILSDIQALDGSILTDYSFYFTTRMVPLYALAERVRMELDPLLKDVPDDTINQLLHKWSVRADRFNYTGIDAENHASYRILRADYVVCKTISDIFNSGAITRGDLQKRLGDLFIRRGIGSDLSLDKLLAKYNNCGTTLEEMLKRGGDRGNPPKGFVKGLEHPERPYIGRLWLEPDGSVDNLPAANTIYAEPNSLRGRRTYKGRNAI